MTVYFLVSILAVIFMAASLESLVTAILILLAPVILAIPLSLGWKWWVGTEPEHVHYREKVRLVLDAGLPLSRFRKELDAEARIVNIDPERQSRIESDLLFPMRVKHFLLMPGLVVWPFLGLFAAFLAIPLMPILWFFQWLLIEKKVLLWIGITVQKITRWEIIGIPRVEDGLKNPDPVLSSINRMPITVFLGLFAFLIVTYLPLDTQSVLVVSGAVYIILVAFISVIRAGTLSTMVFADTGNRRLLPMGTFVEDMLGPWVGVGLLFLISRQLFYGTELRSGEMFGDPVIFSLAILLVLYTATMIGVAVEISFFRSRAESVRVKFQDQMIDEFEPQLYLFTRNLGMLKISRLMTLRQWVEQGERINLNDLDKLKRS
tara:strand:+ start:1117 stop:2244 length:1128 start_codon:yes stop_codon:yes gene_type:complete